MFKKIVSLLLISFLILVLLSGCASNNVIGEVYGTEHEYIRIGGDTYTLCNNPGVNKNRDRDKKLGKVVFRNNPSESMMVWSLKGYSNKEYIYILFGSTMGHITKKINNITKKVVFDFKMLEKNDLGRMILNVE